MIFELKALVLPLFIFRELLSRLQARSLISFLYLSLSLFFSNQDKVPRLHESNAGGVVCCQQDSLQDIFWYWLLGKVVAYVSARVDHFIQCIPFSITNLHGFLQILC